MADLLIGIDFGGTHIKVGCFDEALRLHKRGSVATEVDMGPTLVVDHIVGAITALLDCTGHKLGDIRAAGIGIPGPADYQAGILINSTHMPGFRNTPLRQMLIDRLHCPVAFNSDTNVACFGEFTAGAGEDVDDMVFFTLGTGIGCGIISHGKLIQGATGSAAGVGHVIVYPEGEPCNCGQRGCAEAYASAANTARRARAAIEAVVLDIARRAEAGQRFRQRHGDAGEGRRVAQRVLARFGVAQLHHQVEKVLRAVGLERNDELLVVDAVGVRRV